MYVKSIVSRRFNTFSTKVVKESGRNINVVPHNEERRIG